MTEESSNDHCSKLNFPNLILEVADYLSRMYLKFDKNPDNVCLGFIFFDNNTSFYLKVFLFYTVNLYHTNILWQNTLKLYNYQQYFEMKTSLIMTDHIKVDLVPYNIEWCCVPNVVMNQRLVKVKQKTVL